MKSYKPKALPMFKRFCSAVSKSNGNYVFDAGVVNSDEKTLVGKLIGLIFQEEEYVEIILIMIIYQKPMNFIINTKVPQFN